MLQRPRRRTTFRGRRLHLDGYPRTVLQDLKATSQIHIRCSRPMTHRSLLQVSHQHLEVHRLKGRVARIQEERAGESNEQDQARL